MQASRVAIHLYNSYSELPNKRPFSLNNLETKIQYIFVFENTFFFSCLFLKCSYQNSSHYTSSVYISSNKFASCRPLEQRFICIILALNSLINDHSRLTFLKKKSTLLALFHVIKEKFHPVCLLIFFCNRRYSLLSSPLPQHHLKPNHSKKQRFFIIHFTYLR